MTRLIDGIIRRHTKPLHPEATGWSSTGRLLCGIKAVLWDVYGTLFISDGIELGNADPFSQAAAMRDALRDAGIEHHGPAVHVVTRLLATIRDAHARARRESIEYPEIDIVSIWRATLQSLAEQEGEAAPVLDESVLRRLAVEYECRVNPVWPMPNGFICVNALREAGILLGIVSNAQFYTRELFPALLGATPEQMGFHPDLQFYSYEWQEAKAGGLLHDQAKRALLQLGIFPEETLCIGNDMRSDIVPAHRVGFRTALFAGDRRGLRLRLEDELAARTSPDLIVTDLGDLPPRLGCTVRRERIP